MARTNDDRLAGRVALVTDGSSGIGAATVRRLLTGGVKVASLLGTEECSFATGATYDLVGGRAVG